MRFRAGVVHQESQVVPTIEVFFVGGGGSNLNGEYQRDSFAVSSGSPKKTLVIRVLRWFFERHNLEDLGSVDLQPSWSIREGSFHLPPQKRRYYGLPTILEYRSTGLVFFD